MLSLCKNCIKHNYNPFPSDKIIFCSVDDNGKHHSYNDQPAKIYKNSGKWWYKHGIEHREKGPAIVIEKLNLDGYLYEFRINGDYIPCYHQIDFFAIKYNNIVIISNSFYKKYNEKIGIILKIYPKPYDNFSLILLDNEKIVINFAGK